MPQFLVLIEGIVHLKGHQLKDRKALGLRVDLASSG